MDREEYIRRIQNEKEDIYPVLYFYYQLKRGDKKKINEADFNKSFTLWLTYIVGVYRLNSIIEGVKKELNAYFNYGKK